MNAKLNTLSQKRVLPLANNRKVWNRSGILEITKIKVYQTVVLTILLYRRETWTTYERHINELNHFHTTCPRKILGIIWQKHFPSSLPSILMQSQLLWAGHVVCMKDHRLPNKQLYGELSQEKRFQGGQKKRFKDTLKVSMKYLGIAPNCLEYRA